MAEWSSCSFSDSAGIRSKRDGSQYQACKLMLYHENRVEKLDEKLTADPNSMLAKNYSTKVTKNYLNG